MIDWPNALTGFGFGVFTTLMFWIPDRLRAKRERRRDIWEQWKVAMRDLEFVAWRPETRSADFHIARSRYPIDHWRKILNDREGFVLLEQLETSYPSVEHFSQQFAADPSARNEQLFRSAEARWQEARVAFANYCRNALSEGYTDMIRREEGQQIRRDLLRHPFKSTQRLRTLKTEFRKPAKK
ncbi:hypothetical protein [Arthrobacter sp. AG258]|uniref:hypothetical protein n=1 Tax=Arthrobacter sp. AG258 TaxID=2183899 RepID=UPI0010613A88|nr:hypothetical protein [Arthrobacter sp. AG258]